MRTSGAPSTKATLWINRKSPQELKSNIGEEFGNKTKIFIRQQLQSRWIFNETASCGYFYCVNPSLSICSPYLHRIVQRYVVQRKLSRLLLQFIAFSHSGMLFELSRPRDCFSQKASFLVLPRHCTRKPAKILSIQLKSKGRTKPWKAKDSFFDLENLIFLASLCLFDKAPLKSLFLMEIYGSIKNVCWCTCRLEMNHHKGIDEVMKIFRLSYKSETSRRKIAFHAFRKRIILLNALSASMLNTLEPLWFSAGTNFHRSMIYNILRSLNWIKPCFNNWNSCKLTFFILEWETLKIFYGNLSLN